LQNNLKTGCTLPREAGQPFSIGFSARSRPSVQVPSS